MVTIRDAVLASTIGWFNGVTITIMTVAPIVIAWHFTNARGMLEKVLKMPPSEDGLVESVKSEVQSAHNSLGNLETCTTEECDQHTIPQGLGVITERDVGIEREIFGFTTVLLRAIAGFIASHAICMGSIIYTFTIRSAVITGKGMPGDVEVFLAIIGPVITSWSFMRAANTISALMTGTTAVIKMRKRIAELISPK
ncbi:hypothetical protein PQC07_gp162 [Aeromonas phage D3]|nr:hypothetical protein PQC07_gp162 [Aeromonas phage D3]YP_010668860.1 hypothetical protein PQC08_gp163 [Aeromonas phage D6]QLM02899.1 hypothetical protein D3_0113 [Aeromonas phage D3]QNH80843.1 hypothetical protein D6_0112 [Aeromonas phage D6]